MNSITLLYLRSLMPILKSWEDKDEKNILNPTVNPNPFLNNFFLLMRKRLFTGKNNINLSEVSRNGQIFASHAVVFAVSFEVDIEPAEYESGPTGLVDVDGFSGFVFGDVGFVHEGVRVSAEDEVDVFGVFGEEDVGYLIVAVFIAQVGEANNVVAVLGAFELSGRFICGLEWIEVLGFAVESGGYEALEFYAYAEDADFQRAFFQHEGGAGRLVQERIAEVVIAVEEREGGMGELLVKAFDAGIEVVVADGGGVVLHARHEFEFQFAAEEIKIGRSLKNVPRIEQQNVFFLLPDLPDEGSSTGCSSLAGIAAAVHRKWLDAAVYIVCMEDG